MQDPTIPDAAAPLLVHAYHPHWMSSILLDPKSQRARLGASGSCGSYRLQGQNLQIAWDDYPADHFRLSQGVYFHTDFIRTEGSLDDATIFTNIPGSGFKAQLRTTGSDIAVFHQVFVAREYDIKDLPAEAPVIVDLGANIGMATLFFAQRYPRARLISLEPDPDNFAVLAGNLAQLPCQPVALQAAIWSDDRTLQIKRSDENGEPLGDWGVQVGRGATDGDVTVEGWTMQRLIHHFGLERIDILKIDIEGAEKELFEAPDLGWLDCVDCILIETHERFKPGSNAAVLKLLDHGFSMRAASGENNVFVRAAPSKPRSVIVTAYYKEDKATLERCISSVRAQHAGCEHILVADGHPQDWIDGMAVRHIKLDRAHGDFGNTPRGVGALLAISEGYDGIGFLDADNWLEPDHVACCQAAAKTNPEADFIIAQWNLRRPDGSILPLPHDPSHVDTNCFYFLPSSFHMLAHFNMMHRELSIVGDRVFAMAMQGAAMRPVTLPHPTVNYSCLWPGLYLKAGEQPPETAKPDIDASHLGEWLRSQTPRDFEIICRRAGVRFAVGANA